MNGVLQELRYALRGLAQRPLFTLVALLSVAVGVGANTTIFSVFNALLLRPPAGIGEPERVVELGRTMGGRGFDTFSYPEVQAIQDAGGAIELTSGYRLLPMSLTTTGDGARVMALAVNHEYFDIMGVTPAAGRFFAADEDATPGSGAVAVVSHAFWQKRMNGDANVIGRTVALNRSVFTIIGVAPEGFNSHSPIVRPEVYIPLTMMSVAQPGFDALMNPNSSWIVAVGRLREGASVRQANDELTAIFGRMRAENPDRYEERSAAAMSISAMPGGGRSPIKAFLTLLLGLVGLILLVTCANVAGMLLARAAAREREIAIRLALGAGRLRLMRQLIVESLVLFTAGGALGVLLATWGASAFSAIHIPAPFPIHFDFTPDWRVLLFGIGLALGTGLLFGLAPALQSTRASVVHSLKNESARSGSGGGRLRRLFVSGQVALTVLLLLSATLFLRALQRASSVDTGFDAQNVAVIGFNLAIDGYDDARCRLFQTQLRERLESMPGVTGAAMANDMPLDLGISENPVYPEDFQSSEENGISSAFSSVDAGYFKTLGIKVVEGRGFDATDRDGSARVAVVSRTFAERVWPGQSAVGKRLRWGSPEDEPRTVIGVIADVKNQMLMEATEPIVYLPLQQQYDGAVTLMVRSSGGVRAASEIIRGTLREMDPRLSTTEVQSLEENAALGLLPQRIAAFATVSFGMLALLLSAMGVYGVVAFMVAQRTREIGLRMALGADRGSVIGLVVKNGMRIAVPGAVIGAALGLALGFLLRAFILGVAPADPFALVVAPAVLLSAVLAACWIPASRAAGIEPIQALRTD
jgi:putative ABC transport system permease protein